MWRTLNEQKIKPQNITPITDDVFPFEDCCCDPQWNSIDHVDEHNCIHKDNEHTVYQRDTVPGTNTVSFAYNKL